MSKKDLAPSSASPVGAIVESNSPNQSLARTNIFTKVAVKRAQYQASPLANRKVEIGGGIFPKISCARGDLLICGAVAAVLIGTFFAAKNGFRKLFSKPESKAKEEDNTPTPPKVQTIVDCVNSAGKPKKVIIPGMLAEGGLSIIAGREGVGKTILGHQVGIELARGYGNLVAEDVSPQNVIIIDGELDDDDYVERFGNMEIPSNITRISECDFANLKQLSEYVKDVAAGLLSPATFVIDNLVALSLEHLSGKAVNEFFRDLKKIQRESEQTITIIIVDHIGKTPEGQTLDNSLLAGSANLARYAHNIVLIDKSARGAGFRYIKCTKQRKAAQPDEVLEVVISDEGYLHFEIIGTASEDDVRNTKTNRKRFGQEVESEGGEDEDDPEPETNGRGRPWTDEDTECLMELAATLENPDKETIGLMMGRHPNYIWRKAKELGVELMAKPRGRKPKQPEPNLQEE